MLYLHSPYVMPIISYVIPFSLLMPFLSPLDAIPAPLMSFLSPSYAIPAEAGIQKKHFPTILIT